jgi:hypothetical protein
MIVLFLKNSFQMILLLVGASAVVIILSPAVSALDDLHRKIDLHSHHLEKVDPVRSVVTFVGIIVGNPTPPGQIE